MLHCHAVVLWRAALFRFDGEGFANVGQASEQGLLFGCRNVIVYSKGTLP